MTTWRVVFEATAAKELRSLGAQDRRRIARFVDERLVTTEDPRSLGHALTGPYAGFWSYRVGQIRLIASIRDDVVTIIVVNVGNRREVYR